MGVQRLGVSTPSANTDTLLYTADYPFLASVIGTNLTTSTSLIDVWVVPTGVTLSSGYVYYAYQTDIPPSNTLETHKFALNIGDRVYVRSTQNTSFNISGLRQVDIQLATGVTSFQNTAPTNPINGQVWVDGDGVAGTNISSLAGYNVQASSATQIPFQIQGASGQTADLQQWDHVNGTPLARVDSTGLMYSQQSPVVNRDGFSAAGKNKVINGDFSIWQRGTIFTSLPSDTKNFFADRWYAIWNGSGSTRTLSRQSFSPGDTLGTYNPEFYMRYAISAAGTGNTYTNFSHKIEDVRTFAGQVVTLSAWMKADTNRTITPYFNQDYNTGVASTNIPGSSWNLTTSWQRFTFTTTLQSLSGKTINPGHSLQVYFDCPAATTFSIDVWGVQVELGSVATPFTTATGSTQGELAACQRYFQSLAWGPTYNTAIHSGHFWSSTKSLGTVHLKTTMRGTPSVVISSPSHVTVYSANATYAVSSIGVDATTPASFDIEFVTSSAGTAGYGTFNRITNTSGYLWISAEL